MTPMRKVKLVGTMVAVVAVMTWVAAANWQEEKAQERQQKIVQDVAALAPQCRPVEADDVVIRGQCLVWNVHAGKTHAAYHHLPEELREQAGSERVTVFLVHLRREEVGRYTVSNEAAYQLYMDVAVVQWPEKQPVGLVSLAGARPKQSREVKQRAEYGDSVWPIVHWIKRLPRVP